jgi:hypothetical protein
MASTLGVIKNTDRPSRVSLQNVLTSFNVANQIDSQNIVIENPRRYFVRSFHRYFN